MLSVLCVNTDLLSEGAHNIEKGEYHMGSFEPLGVFEGFDVPVKWSSAHNIPGERKDSGLSALRVKQLQLYFKHLCVTILHRVPREKLQKSPKKKTS